MGVDPGEGLWEGEVVGGVVSRGGFRGWGLGVGVGGIESLSKKKNRRGSVGMACWGIVRN